MDKKTEALKLALEALAEWKEVFPDNWDAFDEQAIIAIHEALALVNKVDQEESSGTEQPAIPNVITCPFCSSQHVPGWLHDYNMDRGVYGDQPAIKQDLTPEQPAQQQELVAVWELFEDGWDSIADPEWMETLPVGTKLYTSPPAQRKPLTDEQIVKCWGQVSGTRYGYVAFARAIERAHGIKGGK